MTLKEGGGGGIVVGGSINKCGERGHGWEDGDVRVAWTNTKYSKEEDSISGRGMMIGQVPDVKGRFALFFEENDRFLASIFKIIFN